MIERPLDDIFNDALERPAAEREHFIEQACEGDAERIAEVWALIHVQERSSDVMALRPPVGDLDTLSMGESPRRAAAAGACPVSIGRYRVERELGRGGMGTVYLATDPRLRRQVAIKVLNPSIISQASFRARFEREAQLLASINHPNIATIHSLELDGELQFLTMEYVAGQTLAERVRPGALPVDDALHVCRQVAAALEAAHQHGVVHRDLKPPNIKVTGDGLVKVLDFGLALSLGGDAGPAVGEEQGDRGLVVGTPGYMSPEQLRGEAVDHRHDVFAFGCVLFECLTGQHAFGGETRAETIARTLAAAPEFDALPPATPDRVRGMLRLCLQPDAEMRLSAIRDARLILDDAIVAGAVPSEAWRPRPSEVTHNLPLSIDSFVGRDTELQELGHLIGEERLVTLIGAGGAGKTRLAREVACQATEHFVDGVYLVEMADVDGDHVVGSTASTLGVSDQPQRSLLEGIAEFLANKSVLLVFDNIDHVLTEASTLATILLREVPRTHIIVTSRESMALTGEVNFRVSPLSVPHVDAGSDATVLRDNPAVRLFVDRATAVEPRFETTPDDLRAIADICRQLDGLPLAIELAAARSRVLPVADLAKRLADRFRLLTGQSRSTLAHHQTLRALIDWSYEQLSEQEKALFRRLSVFAGGWTLEAAEALGHGRNFEGWEVLDIFFRLIEKSLVELDQERSRQTNQPRYRMLETVRHYARDRLVVAGEEPSAIRRHARHYVELARRAEVGLNGEQQALWLARITAEHDNVTACVDACIAGRVDIEQGLGLAASLGRYWYLKSFWSQAIGIFETLLEASEGSEPSTSRARVARWAADLSFYRGDLDQARHWIDASVAMFRHVGSRAGVANALLTHGNLAESAGDYATACDYYDRALNEHRANDDISGIATVLNNLGLVAFQQGRFDEAQRSYEESLAYRKELGDQASYATTLRNLAELLISTGDLDRAEQHTCAALTIHETEGDRMGIGAATHILGQIAHRRGDRSRAISQVTDGLEIFHEIGNRRAVGLSLYFLAEWHASDQAGSAAELLGAAEAISDAIGAPLRKHVEADYAVVFDRLTELLGEDVLRVHLDRGRVLTSSEAVALALEVRAIDS